MIKSSKFSEASEFYRFRCGASVEGESVKDGSELGREREKQHQEVLDTIATP